MTKINPKPIKVCFIAPKAYPIFNTKEGTYFGGAEVDLYYLATELAKDELFDVGFIVADYGQQPIEHRENVTVIKTIDFNKPLQGIWKVWQGLKRADAHIYLTKTTSPGTPLIALFCKLHKRIYSYRTAHANDCDGTYLKKHPFLGKAFAWSLRQAKILFAQNAEDAENLKATFGVTSHVIPNGHRIPELKQAPRETVLWIGRDAKFKRPTCFLELARSFPDQNFTMVCQTLANNKDYIELKKQAAQIENLTFLSHVPFDHIDNYYQKAKVFVNTSDAEGFPNTFIQACMAAAPILSLNVNPDNFLYEYNCGLCCNGDFNKLIASLADMLKDDKYKRMGENARKYVEQKHDINNIIKQYKNFFIEITKCQ